MHCQVSIAPGSVRICGRRGNESLECTPYVVPYIHIKTVPRRGIFHNTTNPNHRSVLLAGL